MAKNKKNVGSEFKIDSTEDLISLFIDKKKYERKMEDMDRSVLEFYKKAYGLTVDKEELKKLKEKVTKVIGLYENMVGMDKAFLDAPDLHESLVKKGMESAIKLKGLLPVIDVAIENKNSSEEPIHRISSLNAKLLYIKHSGLFECLSKIHNAVDARIAKSISHLTGEKASTIKGLIPNLKKGYSSTITRNTPYTFDAISEAIKSLSETRLRTDDLDKILLEIERKKEIK